MENIGDDSENICRTCLQKGIFVPLAAIHDIFSNHFEILSLCHLELQDGLPQQICSECFEDLRHIMLFMSKCNKAYKVLNGFEALEPEAPKQKEPVKEEIVITIPDEKPDDIKPILEAIPNIPKVLKARKPSVCIGCGSNYTTKKLHYARSPQCRPKNFKCHLCSWGTHCSSKLKIHLRKHVRHRDKLKMAAKSVPRSQVQVVAKNAATSGVKAASDVPAKKKSLKQNVHKCPLPRCCCWYRSNENMLNHLKSVHNKYKCRFCDKLFGKKYAADEHVRLSHSRDASGNGEKTGVSGRAEVSGRVEVKKEVDVKKEPDVNKEAKETSFWCAQCQKSFCSLASLARHRESVFHKKQPTYSAPVQGPMKCPKCPRVFQLKQQLQIHLKVHLQESVVYKCDVCYQAFFNKKILDAHVMATHDDMDGMPVLQPMVNKPPVQSIGSNHADMKGIHPSYSDEKRYECHVCAVWFKWSKTRKSHILKMHGSAELQNIQHLKRKQ